MVRNTRTSIVREETFHDKGKRLYILHGMRERMSSSMCKNISERYVKVS
jgi:hypothetical protein